MRNTASVLLLATLAATSVSAGPTALYVVPEMLELREAPDSSARPIASLKRGDEVTVKETRGTWVRVVSPRASAPGWTPTWTLGSDDPRRASAWSGVTTTDALNVRVEPSFDAPLLAVLSLGSGVTVLEQGPEWSRARISGTRLEGWLQTGTVKPGAVAAGNAPLAEVTPARDRGRARYVAVEGLYLRSAPSIESQPVCLLGAGAIVYPTDDAGQWVRVNVHDGPSGWLCRIYLSETPDAPYGGVRLVGPQIEARIELQARREYLGDNEGMVYQDRVNVRTGPSEEFPVISVMPAGVVFRVLGESGGWYKALFADGTQGWVASWLCVANRMPEDQPPGVTLIEPPQPSPQPSRPTPNSIGVAIAQYAASQVGKPYVWGAESPSTGFDCSGLVWWAHKQVGIDLPRVSFDQFRVGLYVPPEALIPGDVVFFANTYTGGASHVGIYWGNGWFVHAPGTGKRVRFQMLSERASSYCGARRMYVQR